MEVFNGPGQGWAGKNLNGPGRGELCQMFNGSRWVKVRLNQIHFEPVF